MVLERLFERARPTRAAPRRERRAAELDGAKFRFLNDLLYTQPSSAAVAHFQANPAAFVEVR